MGSRSSRARGMERARARERRHRALECEGTASLDYWMRLLRCYKRYVARARAIFMIIYLLVTGWLSACVDAFSSPAVPAALAPPSAWW